MAKKAQDLELDVDGRGDSTRSSKKKLIVIAIVMIVLLAGGGAAAWFLFAAKDGDAEAVAKIRAPIYLSIDPPLVVNFESPGRARYLQVGMDLLTHDPAVIAAVNLHMPAIRNELIIYFSGKGYDELASREGKEAAKSEVLVAVNRIIADRGAMGKVDDVYFTSFVMQ